MFLLDIMPRKYKKRKRNDLDDPDGVQYTFDFTVYGEDKDFRDDEIEHWMQIFDAWKADCTRIQVCREICPTTEREHLQCKLTWKVGKRWAAMRKLMGTTHFEVSASECFAYCAKPESQVLVSHDSRQQGKRSDLQACIDAAAGGASQRTLFKDFGPTMVRYREGIRAAQKALKEPVQLANYTLADFPMWEPITDWSETIILGGAAGAGKTEFACAHFKNPKLVTEIDELLDYDPMEHDGIVFDDMDFRKETRNIQIALVDQTMPRAIRCRYRSPEIPKGTKKIFTCNEWCFSVDDAAIKRRIRQIIAIDRETELAIGK